MYVECESMAAGDREVGNGEYGWIAVAAQLPDIDDARDADQSDDMDVDEIHAADDDGEAVTDATE